MKRIITAVAVIFLMAATAFSQTTETSVKKIDNKLWLDNYEALINRMQAVDADSASTDSINQWCSERSNIRTEYRTVYKDSLTESEGERYFSLNAQYTKALAKFRLSDAGTQLSGVGEKASELGSKVKDKAADLTDNVKDKAVDIKDNVVDKAQNVGDKASEIADNVKDKAKKVGNKISGWFKGLKKNK